MTFDAKDETLSDLSDGKLHLNKEGLYGILLKTVPKTVCNSIEKLLNIKKIYGIGFTKDNQLFGTIVIFLKEGAGELKNKQIIEALLKQASIAVQKKQAEEALRESEEKFRYLVKNSNDVFVTIDKNGKEIFVSDSVERITGFTPAETMGRSGFEFLHPDDVDHMSETLSKLLETPGGTIRDEYRHRRKGGGWVHLEAIGTNYLHKPSIKGIVLNVRDITERTLVEETLRESEEKYRSLVESTEDYIYLVDRNCAYMFMNKEYLSKFGMSEDKVIGRRYDEFHSKDETKEFRGRVNAVIKTGKSSRYVYESERVGGHYLRTLSPVKDLKGNIVAVTVVSKDITELKQAEGELRQANEELSREQNQRRILSKRLIDLLEKDRRQIAMELHDHIGQTLTSLKMNLEMIHGKLQPDNTELEAQITVSQEKTIQAIKDVRNISRGLRPGMLDALGLVPSLRELFNEIQRQTDIEIRFFSRNIPKRLAPEKELAIYRIAQEALTNIIRHAKAKNVFVNLVKKDENLSLSAEDDGVGFDQDKILTFSEKKGPLGILIMRERAEQLDGDFTLESQIGKGTHLLVEIPL
ncbi:MAG: PAS domain S-box protein [Deltaproteobacteria bacterium]|nr:PAS domain S-box protein [Deltaproteobacteria bacterium]